MAKSMPKARLKSLKLFNSSTMNPNTTWSSLLKSYHPYLPLQKVKKICKHIIFTITYPKMQKAILVAFVL
jgi:hypothetical protein